jgi:hypothetical protein
LVCSSCAWSPTCCSIARRSFKVEQQQPAIVGHFEDEGQHARLRVVEIEDARQQERAEIGDGRADRMALFAEDIPEDGRARSVCGLRRLDELEALEKLRRRAPGCVMPDRSPLTSAMNTGTPIREKTLGHHLQRDRLSGAGRSGDEAVAVGERRQKAKLGVSIPGNGQRVGHGGSRAGRRAEV